jgi:hypothetical protein
MKPWAPPAALVLALGSTGALALPDAGTTGPLDAAVPSDGAVADAGPTLVEGTCTEHIPAGKTRPKLHETFPARGLAGYALTLEVVVEHGRGETVLPDGFRAVLGTDESKRLTQAGFVLPEPDAGAAYEIVRTEQGDQAKTTVRVPFVALPKRSGRQEAVLPAVPVAIARASGDVVTLCTAPHRITLDDPIANLPSPEPQPNPLPRRQLEVWTLLKHVTIASLIALAVGALVAWLIGRWLRRPRVAPPPPPPRPPWEVALEELHDLRHAGLIEQQRYAEHFDRSSYTVRKYLGGRYGFDGLESTTWEILDVLRRVVPPVGPIEEIVASLRQADLVKFARLTPTPEECRIALDRGEDIVGRTVPPVAGLGDNAPPAAFPAEPPPAEDGGGAA